jgi:hypothetical protein
MTLHYREITIKCAFAFIMCLLALTCLSQQAKPNKYYTAIKQTQTLDSIFPVDDILSITVTNYYGTHKLTRTELSVLKEQLKQAKFAGGLIVKPGHISLKITLKDNTTAKPGFVYAYEGSIHFDGGINRFNKHFSASYYLPVSLNFDNYK